MRCDTWNHAAALGAAVFWGLPVLLSAAIATGSLGDAAPVHISGTDTLLLTAPKQGDKGWYWHGLVCKHDGVWNLLEQYALRFEVKNSGGKPFTGTIELDLASGQGRKNLQESSKASFTVPASSEWRTVEIPFDSFDFARGDKLLLEFVEQIRFSGNGGAEIRNVQLIEAPGAKLSAYIRSRAAENGRAEYEFELKNCLPNPETYRLTLEKEGWEGMPATLSADSVTLAPGETCKLKLNVAVPAGLPAGAHERQSVRATPLTPNLPAAALEFITVQRVPSPFLPLDAKGWQGVKDKIARYDWAKKQAEEYIRTADRWNPPTRAGVMSDQGTMGVVRTRYEDQYFSCIVAYLLTGEEKYRKKVLDFLLLMSNPKDGYPVLLHATSQGIPQEGGTFELIAEAYDAIRDTLTPQQREEIEHTMRLYIDTVIRRIGDSGISNWAVFNQVPAVYCALVLHDIARFNELMYGPTGLINQFRYGTMDDGWWYEVSITYNVHCAECFTKAALAARNFGIDLLNVRFPAANSNLISRHPYCFDRLLGMSFIKSGPVRQNMIGIKAMWDGILDYPDYRGIMFGMGDGHEMEVSGYSFDLAYYAFRDPRYAAIIRSSPKRDLIFGVGELPDLNDKLYEKSAHSDNAGIAVLRSQKGEIRDRIQAGFKYGIHGGYHGHFDRLSLLCLMRYGRGFYNPETSWYGYPSYLYKWWVQTSLAHNMVVVDGKLQEPTDCPPILFHSGDNLQVVAAENTARWSNPAYLGGYEKIDEIRKGEERYVPIPENHPAIAEVTGYTEPVYQRRLQAVTDDYVVIADYAKAENEHAFDNLLHLRGAKVLGGLEKTGHRAQYDDSPLSSGQFIVNVDEYVMTAPARLTSRHHFNEKDKSGKNQKGALELTDCCYHEPGDLMIDAYVAYPEKAEMLIADYPESQPVNKRLRYEVRGDDKILADGMFQAWILGRGKIDADVTGVKTLVLSTTRDWCARNSADTLFWGDAVLVTKNGKEIRLASLKPEAAGLRKPPAPGVDYCGGPVRIEGITYPDAIGAEPAADKKEGTLAYDLAGLDAVRLKAVVGGDFPAGQEENLRKVTAVRARGKEARFLTVLEPREGKPRVESVRALDPETIEIKLVDGTVDRMKITGFDSTDKTPVVELYRNGKLLETTKQK